MESIITEKKSLLIAWLVIILLVAGYVIFSNKATAPAPVDKSALLKLLPSEYVLDSDAKLILSDAQGNGTALLVSKVFTSQLSAEHLAARYRGYFPAKGWIMTSDLKPDRNRYLLVFYKNGPQLTVNVSPDAKDPARSRMLLEYYPKRQPTSANRRSHPVLDKYLKLFNASPSPRLSPTPAVKGQ